MVKTLFIIPSLFLSEYIGGINAIYGQIKEEIS